MAKVKNVSRLAVLFTVCSAQFMVPLMLTAVGVALPAMGRELNGTALHLGLVEQLYTLSLAMTMLAFGRLGDLVGRRKAFLAGSAWFTAATCSLGFAGSIEAVIVLRLLQGMGASLLLSGSMALVASAFPFEMRGRAFGIVGVFTYSGLTLGPVLGGFITTHFGWRWVFLMAAPLGALGCLLCLTHMRGEWRSDKPGNMDWLGAAVYAASLACIMLGASHAGDPRVGGPVIGAGLVLLVAFGVLETKLKDPLLDVTTFLANRLFSLSCLAAMGNYAATFGVTFFMSLYLQFVLGLPPHQAGLTLLLQPLGQVLVSPFAGILADRLRPTLLANVGLALSGCGLLLAAVYVGPATSRWLIAGLLGLIGLGVGIFITPNTVLIMGSVEPEQYGVASGMVGAMRTLGMAASMTVATLVFSLFMGGQSVTPETVPGFLFSMRLCLAVFAAFCCLGTLASLARGGQYHAPGAPRSPS